MNIDVGTFRLLQLLRGIPVVILTFFLKDITSLMEWNVETWFGSWFKQIYFKKKRKKENLKDNGRYLNMDCVSVILRNYICKVFCNHLQRYYGYLKAYFWDWSVLCALEYNACVTSCDMQCSPHPDSEYIPSICPSYLFNDWWADYLGIPITLEQKSLLHQQSE